MHDISLATPGLQIDKAALAEAMRTMQATARADAEAEAEADPLPKRPRAPRAVKAMPRTFPAVLPAWPAELESE